MSTFHTKPIYPKQQNIGTVLWATVELSEMSEGTVGTEDTTDAVPDCQWLITDVLVFDNEVAAVEEHEHVAASRFEDLDVDVMLLVPWWVAFPQAVEDLQMSCISLKYGHILPQRFWNIAFLYKNYEWVTKTIWKIQHTLLCRKDLTKSS